AEITLTIAAPQTITCTTPQITLNASASVVPAGSTIIWTTVGGSIMFGGEYSHTRSECRRHVYINCFQCISAWKSKLFISFQR
ncbi:hypothetical protein, partial [Chryseobacterium jejuense]|uniref:hypothetical protein n=1 Tax=Chryseobacterium jejuense TaxID=445960 RepID=UPI001E2F86CB